ncbi:unnamed protein product [Sphagnum jensenii]|uniref:FRIGIDA-like protein n=1 Tax=Sphagnum jensenii TaxID=128206 RepID=A0ABP1AX39_9BRYO
MATEEDPIAQALEAGSERKDRLEKVFANLEVQRRAIMDFTMEWKDFEDYFADLDRSLQQRFQDLIAKEEAFESKSKQLQETLDKREEAVSAREQAMLSRVQEQKDSAIASLFEEKRKWQEEKNRLEAEAAVSDVRVRPQLKALCENMDGDGLRKFLVDHRKDVGAMRTELPPALQCAIDPARMVLGALDGYHLPDPVGPEKNRDAGAFANRRACILLLECLAVALADPVLGSDHPVVPSNIKESAKQVADHWKSKMDSTPVDAPAFPLDAQAFLQLLTTFGLAPEYNDDELCKLVSAIARRRQTPALYRSLGLSAKIPDVVDRLAKEGKQIEALSFAHSFGIMSHVQPVPLLKTYLKEARKTAQSLLKTGKQNSSTAAQNDAAMKELAALKAVLKCIEDYDLENQFPSMPLLKRVGQLEKAKSDRKRTAVAVKANTKRPRASNVTGGEYGAVPVPNNNNDNRNYYRPPPDRSQGQYSIAVGPSYALAPQNNYDRRVQGAYSTTYAGGNRSPVSLSSSYLYPADGLTSQVYSSTGYNNPPATYSNYQFGSGLPPPPPAYQASFLH